MPALAVGRRTSAVRPLRSRASPGRKCRRNISTPLPMVKNQHWRRSQRQKCGTSMSLIAPTNHWGCWAALSFAAAAGMWSETTPLGRQFTGQIVTILIALAFSNIGVIPFDAPVYGFVNKYLLPLAVPLLLFQGNLTRVFKETGRLLTMFSLGSIGTILGTLVAMYLIPLHSLGADGWKIASALAARHIGGAINYVSTTAALDTSGDAVASGLAADNILCALYFALLFYLARHLGPDEEAEGQSQGQLVKQASGSFSEEYETPLNFLQCATAIAVSSFLCACGSWLACFLGFPGYSIPLITLLVTFVATVFPGWLEPLSPSGEGLAGIIINIFLASVGASGSIVGMLTKAPSLFLFCFVQVGVHLLVCFLLGRLFGFDRRDVLLASNANVGGPTTAVAMAVSKGWRRSFVPAMLVGTFGYAIATFLCVALGFNVLRFM